MSDLDGISTPAYGARNRTRSREQEQALADADHDLQAGVCTSDLDGIPATGVAMREIPSTGILQAWVAVLGLRHQGVLLTVVRGCDTAPKHDKSKALSRAMRGCILNTHCADPRDATSFIEQVTPEGLVCLADEFRKDCDHYPHHYVMHVVHAMQVIGACHPNVGMASAAWYAYRAFCAGLHVQYEDGCAMNVRLGAEETVFGEAQGA